MQKDGIGAASLREVARRAGVSHAAPYRHFPNKEAMLAAVAEEGFHAFQDALEKASLDVASPLGALQAIGIAYVQFALAHPAHFRIMFGPEGGEPCDYPALVAASAGAFGVLVATIQRCIDAGALRKRPASELALVAWSAVHGLASLLLDGMLQGAGSPEDLAKAVTSNLVLGLGLPGGA